MKDFAPIRVAKMGFTGKGYFWTYFRMIGVVWLAAVVMAALPIPEPVMSAAMIALITLFMAVVFILPLGQAVWLEPERVRLTCFGLTVRKMEAAQIQMICVAGDFDEDLLCLSTYSLEELAQRRLRQRSFITRSDRYTPRPAVLANEYLCKAARRPFGDRGLLWIPMHSRSAAVVRSCYPQLSFFDWQRQPVTGYGDLLPGDVKGRKVCLREDGVWLEGKKDASLHIPASEIRTILRLDNYGGGRYATHLQSYWAVSTQMAEELAAKARRLPPGMEQLPFAEELRAAAYTSRSVFWWTAKRRDLCPMCHTPGREAQLRRLYPNARVVDLSALWREVPNSSNSMR